MANRTNLGSMLGQVLSGFNGDNQQKGYNEGIKARVGLSTIDKNNAEAQLKQQQLDNGSDDSLLSSVLSKIGANSQGGKDDLLATMAGTYKPLAGPPTQAQDRAGALAVPPPQYLSKLPQAANDFATLKQMLALGDPNYNHIAESAQQEQVNKVTQNITPENAYDVATNIGARNGAVEAILKAQTANKIANDGQPRANERSNLSLNGKTEFGNMGSEGTFNQITGDNSINAIGQSVIKKNNETKDAKEHAAPSGYSFNPDNSLSFIKGGPADPAIKKAESLNETDMVDYGLPKPQTPWANTTDSKARDRFKQKEYEIARKKIETIGEEVDKYKSLASRADRFLQLNKKVETGALADKIPAGQWMQSFGADYAEMQAITADIVPEMREKGSGSTSDFDAKMFQRATVGVDKPGPANTNIVTGIKAKMQNVSDHQDFSNAYLEQNGTLTGADTAWKKYVNSNPIFDVTKNDYSLNKARQSWSDYFASNKSAAKVAPASNPSQGLSFTMPNGKKFNFKDQKSMDSFKREAGVK